MPDRMDLTFLDQPEIIETMFPIVYSPVYSLYNLRSNPPDVPTYSIEVENGIKINCGFWISGKECSTILYFHGNGETIATHDWIAPLYNQRGINLFVADYRGYGTSDGKPTVSNMIGDAHAIFQGFKEIMAKESFKRSLFLMGRSLGNTPAIELASNYQDDICGLIVESGAANNFRRLWNYLGLTAGEQNSFLNKIKIRQVHKPTLIMHGEYDQMISVDEAKELYQNSGAQEKEILIIPGADHNSIQIVAQDLYFGTIDRFIKAYGTLS